MPKFTIQIENVKFAIVDIETTGLFHQGHEITEIAVVHPSAEGPQLVFHSFVKTTRAIPAAITGLTGIRNSDTDSAPEFKALIPDLQKALEGRIFVAHNVNFDYQFLKAYFERYGISFKHKRLCTYRLAKKVFPSLRSYSLTLLCAQLGIDLSQAHRAHTDAFAAAHLLSTLIEKDQHGSVNAMLHNHSREAILPPSIEKKQIDDLPESPGVYYFYNQSDKLIYIGKSKNLKKRVLSHFTSSGSTRRKQLFQRLVSKLDYTQTANEYMASLREDAEIKKHWPRLNVAQKHGSHAYAVLHYVNRLNERRFGIKKTTWSPDALAWFGSFSAARNWLGDELSFYGIHPKRGGFYTPEGKEWNEDKEGVESFLQTLATDSKPSYVLLSDNQGKTHSFAAVLDGKYRGYGKISLDKTINRDNIESALIQAPDSVTVQSVLQHMKLDKEVERYELE